MGWKQPPQDYAGGVFDKNELPQDIFPAKLTAVSGGLYSWTEQIATGPNYAGWVDLPGGRSGTNTVSPAYEPNDATIDITDEPVVFMMIDYLDATLDWVYVIVGTVDSGGGSSLTVEDGSTTVTGVTTIDFTSGATVSNLGGGVAGVAVSGGGGSLLSDGTTVTLPAFATTRLGVITIPSTGNYLIVGNTPVILGSTSGNDVELLIATDVAGSPASPPFAIQATNKSSAGGDYNSVSYLGNFSTGDVVGLYIIPGSQTPVVTGLLTAIRIS